MKKIGCLLCFIAICFSLCACDPGTYKISEDALKDVTSIDLIEYKNSNQKNFGSWIPDHFDDLVPFESSNATVIEQLQEEKISDFLDAFMQTDILDTYYAYDSPADVCIRLNYANGNFLIIWANYKRNAFAGYIGEYSADGEVLSFWGSFSGITYYRDLVNNFFEYKI